MRRTRTSLTRTRRWSTCKAEALWRPACGARPADSAVSTLGPGSGAQPSRPGMMAAPPRPSQACPLPWVLGGTAGGQFCLTGPPRLLSSEGSGSRRTRRPWAWLQGPSLEPSPRPGLGAGHVPTATSHRTAAAGRHVRVPKGLEKYFLEQSCSLPPACEGCCSRVRTSDLQEGGAGRLPCAPTGGRGHDRSELI